MVRSLHESRSRRGCESAHQLEWATIRPGSSLTDASAFLGPDSAPSPQVIEQKGVTPDRLLVMLAFASASSIPGNCAGTSPAPQITVTFLKRRLSPRTTCDVPSSPAQNAIGLCIRIAAATSSVICCSNARTMASPPGSGVWTVKRRSVSALSRSISPRVIQSRRACHRRGPSSRESESPGQIR
jgi:hypothetical protein